MEVKVGNRKKMIYLISALLIAFLALLIVLIIANHQRSNILVRNFEECAATGAPIMESYPEQCRYNGITYTRELTPEEKKNLYSGSYPADEYYGSATGAACDFDEECVVMGCNSEICGGVNEEPQVSICIAPDKPTPKDLGYTCGCFQQKCLWGK